jgi:hypothetical protein
MINEQLRVVVKNHQISFLFCFQMFRSAIILSCLLFGFCQANPHQAYQNMQQATERQGFG